MKSGTPENVQAGQIEACSHCRYAIRYGEDTSGKSFLCRRFPPQVINMPETKLVNGEFVNINTPAYFFPVVLYHVWCGEFKPSE
jgi:hypothetical protein